MKKIILIIAVLVLLVGCQSKKAGNMDVEVEKDGTNTKINIENEVGNQEIKISSKNADDWCAAGSTWSSTSTQGSAEMVIVGIETSGKYKGYCHVTYDVDGKDTQADIDYYFDEDNNGYQVMIINGQKFESEWSGEE